MLTNRRNLLGAGIALALGTMLSVLPVSSAHANAQFVIVNVNGPNVGFNDPTPVAPVGGNPGTTLGQQRLNAFQYAADQWGNTLDSAVPIRVQAQFSALTCTTTAATLGSAGPTEIFANLGVGVPGFWYHGAEADKLAFTDLDPSTPDINANFNVNLGNPGCLDGIHFYLGLDDNHGTDVDLVTVLLHEFAHGLGFSTVTSTGNGAMINGIPDIYDSFLHDDSSGLDWPLMTNAQRVTSAINYLHLSWSGSNVDSNVPNVLNLGSPGLSVASPAAIAGFYSVGAAQFGPAVSAPGVTGNIVLADDGVGVGSDACTALTPANAAAVNNNIALVDRGTCTFVVKAGVAQAAGAKAVLVVNNAAGSPPPGLAGVDPTITIPVVGLIQSDGALIKAQLGSGVTATLGVDPTRYAGANDVGNLLLYTPNPRQSGSTVSHWDTSAARNLLMEPAINDDLTHSVIPPEDLTLAQLRDVGWYADQDLDGAPDDQDQCADSILDATVKIGSCDSKAPNVLFTNGCTISDEIRNCADAASNHGEFVSCVTHFTTAVREATQVLNGKSRAAIQVCAAQSTIP